MTPPPPTALTPMEAMEVSLYEQSWGAQHALLAIIHRLDVRVQELQAQVEHMRPCKGTLPDLEWE